MDNRDYPGRGPQRSTYLFTAFGLTLAASLVVAYVVTWVRNPWMALAYTVFCVLFFGAIVAHAIWDERQRDAIRRSSAPPSSPRSSTHPPEVP